MFADLNENDCLSTQYQKVKVNCKSVNIKYIVTDEVILLYGIDNISQLFLCEQKLSTES